MTRLVLVDAGSAPAPSPSPLGPEELAALARLRVEHVRKSRELLYIARHRALVALGVPARVGHGPLGAPILADLPALRLGLAHTDRWLLIALSARPCGVDLEPAERLSADDPLVERFAAGERAAIAALRARDGHAAGARLATACFCAKEAVLKRLGWGLRVPYGTIRIHMAAPPAAAQSVPDATSEGLPAGMTSLLPLPTRAEAELTPAALEAAHRAALPGVDALRAGQRLEVALGERAGLCLASCLDEPVS